MILVLRGEIDPPRPYGNQWMWSITAIGLALTGIANLWSLFDCGGKLGDGKIRTQVIHSHAPGGGTLRRLMRYC